MLQFDLQFYEELTVAQVKTVKFISGAFFWPSGQLVYCKGKHSNCIALVHVHTSSPFYILKNSTFTYLGPIQYLFLSGLFHCLVVSKYSDPTCILISYAMLFLQYNLAELCGWNGGAWTYSSHYILISTWFIQGLWGSGKMVQYCNQQSPRKKPCWLVEKVRVKARRNFIKREKKARKTCTQNAQSFSSLPCTVTTNKLSEQQITAFLWFNQQSFRIITN